MQGSGLYNQCMRKNKYRSKERAMRVLKKIKKSGVIVNSDAHAYKCNFCDGWHLGHKVTNDKERR